MPIEEFTELALPLALLALTISAALLLYMPPGYRHMGLSPMPRFSRFMQETYEECGSYSEAFQATLVSLAILVLIAAAVWWCLLLAVAVLHMVDWYWFVMAALVMVVVSMWAYVGWKRYGQ